MPESILIKWKSFWSDIYFDCEPNELLTLIKDKKPRRRGSKRRR